MEDARRQGRPVSETMHAALTGFIGQDPPVAIRWWDGSVSGSPTAGTTIEVRSPDAVKRLIFTPGELALARAYVAGEIDIEGDIFEVLKLREALAPMDQHVEVGLDGRDRLRFLAAALRVGALGMPPAPPREEARLGGRLHSRKRDAEAIAHHYNLSNDFYSLVLGPSMTYSCAYFDAPEDTLESAQEAKYDLIARKLGLEPGMRVLDVGCGWGGMVMHAAARYGVSAVGITISEPQARLAADRLTAARLGDVAEVRIQDYRDVSDGPYDAISSIGMFEHVGAKRLGEYFGSLHRLLRPQGRLLNHAISRPSGKAGFDPRSFTSRYVFPDGELQEVGSVVSAMHAHGFEVRDVESLREHYALTLRRWVANLERHWDKASELVGQARARVWRLYMAGSALGFEAGRISIHQTLGIRKDPDGSSGMPLRRGRLAATPAESS